jgi:hypothetical protein
MITFPGFPRKQQEEKKMAVSVAKEEDLLNNKKDTEQIQEEQIQKQEVDVYASLVDHEQRLQSVESALLRIRESI